MPNACQLFGSTFYLIFLVVHWSEMLDISVFISLVTNSLSHFLAPWWYCKHSQGNCVRKPCIFKGKITESIDPNSDETYLLINSKLQHLPSVYLRFRRLVVQPTPGSRPKAFQSHVAPDRKIDLAKNSSPPPLPGQDQISLCKVGQRWDASVLNWWMY